MNECSEVGGEKRLKSLQMRGRKEMRTSIKALSPHGTASRLKTVLSDGEEKSINNIKWGWEKKQACIFHRYLWTNTKTFDG